MIARVTLYVIASWLLAAHFLRDGHVFLVAVCVVAPLLFLLRRRGGLLLLQVLAYAATVVWLATAWQIATTRREFGEPWLRAAFILVAVAAISLLAGLLLRGRIIQQRYRGR